MKVTEDVMGLLWTVQQRLPAPEGDRHTIFVEADSNGQPQVAIRIARPTQGRSFKLKLTDSQNKSAAQLGEEIVELILKEEAKFQEPELKLEVI